MASSNDSSLKKNLPVNKTGTKVKIGLPSLCNYDDDSDEEEEVLNANLKKQTPAAPTVAPKPAEKPRSGLFSVLPPPKSNPFVKPAASSATTTSSTAQSSSTSKPKSSSSSFLIPRTVKTTPSAAAPSVEALLPRKHKLDEDNDEDYGGPCTSSAADEPLPRPTASMPGPSKMPFLSQYNDDDDDEEEDEDQQQQAYYNPAQAQQPLELDAESLQKLVGGKRRLNEHIEVRDVSARDIIGDSSRSMTKQITEEYKPSTNKDYFSSNSKRKHQITYLAYVAKEREQELKNEWAQSKVNRMQSRMKYGF